MVRMTRALEIALWLALYAMLMLFAALPVRAEVIQCGSDTVKVSREGFAVVLTYSNSEFERSGSCRQVEIDAEGALIEFTVGVNLGENSSERFTVVPPIGWGAVPEQIDVQDGETGKVYVTPWLF